MNGHGKSDRPIVPAKSPNKGSGASGPAEGMEGRGRAEGNSGPPSRSRTQGRNDLQPGLTRIRQAAEKDRTQKFTALWHHVYPVERLRESYQQLRHDTTPGVDGQTWQDYGRDLETNLQDLSDRLRRGAYRAKPVQRTYIPKADGRQRPIGMPTLEDKIVQRATAKVMQAIYEADFLGFSYGFRPNRGAHQALDALTVGLSQRKVSWILDADIRGFFDTLDHEWLIKFIEHRIADRRVVRHIRKWLDAGVLEDGTRTRTEEGVPQGGSISPVLANVYLHYVFDLWADHWRRHQATGDVIIVRYADDFVVGFQYRSEAERFWKDLRERFHRFHLELHAEKTRLIEFGRFVAERRAKRGDGKPETFNFLGFTHVCGKTRKTGAFIVVRRTIGKRMRAKLREIKEQLRKRLHARVSEVGQWLRSVLNGYYRYYAVPLNYPALKAFYRQVIWLWGRSLRRRSQKHRLTWKDILVLADQWLPPPKIMHPFPWDRLHVTTQGKSPVR